MAGSFSLFSLEISAMSNDAHEATALPDEPALTPEALEELDEEFEESQEDALGLEEDEDDFGADEGWEEDSDDEDNEDDWEE